MAQAKLGKGKAVRGTAAALLIKLEDTPPTLKRRYPEGIWFPKSQIDDDSEVYDIGHEGEVIVSEWIAEEKGLA